MFRQRLVYSIAEKETKLLTAARTLDELRSDAAAVLSGATDVHSAVSAISQLKRRAIEAKQKTACELEQCEEEKSTQVKLPQLPMLPSTVEELKQKIALHNVSSV